VEVVAAPDTYQGAINMASVHISASSAYILSTSGRELSMRRYTALLQTVLGLDVVYMPISSGSDKDPAIDPSAFAAALRGLNCIGGAISRDIKNSIIPFLDEVDDTARSINSVNTVIVRADEGRKKRLIGYNTDALGFKLAIAKSLPALPRGIKRALCYGYGGVTLTVVAVLRELGAESIFITGRRKDEAKRRAEELGVEVWEDNVSDNLSVPPIDLFVNAAPVTNAPLDQASNFLSALDSSRCPLVFDHELEGVFLIDYCRQKGIAHISGKAMYEPQRDSQWALFLSRFNVEEGQLPALFAKADELIA